VQVLLFFVLIVVAADAQDTRHVTEPVIPSACTTLEAKLSADGASAIRVSDLTIDGADNGIRIKSNSSRGGLVHDVVYEDVCIRNTKNPIYMDSNYSYYVKDRDKLPAFTDITLRNVRIAGSGKITLDGYDAAHRLAIRFENVVLENPEAVKITAVHPAVVIGPGTANIAPAGEDVTIKAQPGGFKGSRARAKVLTFPSREKPGSKLSPVTASTAGVPG
jgi:polygalacturonase